MRIKAGSRSKYHAVPTVIDGIRFASKKEARRYSELRLLERAGEIADLRLQPRFDLHVTAITWGGEVVSIGAYVGDFSYSDTRADGKTIIEDTKGFRTPLYRWKKKHVEAQYGIVIREV